MPSILSLGNYHATRTDTYFPSACDGERRQVALALQWRTPVAIVAMAQVRRARKDKTMSFLNGLSGDFLKRLSGGNMDPAQPNDQQDMGQLMGGVPQDAFQQHATNAIGQVDPQEYQNHIMPGVGGTNPLGGLGKGMLGSGSSSALVTLVHAQATLLRRGERRPRLRCSPASPAFSSLARPRQSRVSSCLPADTVAAAAEIPRARTCSVSPASAA